MFQKELVSEYWTSYLMECWLMFPSKKEFQSWWEYLSEFLFYWELASE